MNGIDIGLGVLHVATGLFFTTTGSRKCFLPEVRSKVCGLFDRYNVPKPAQWLVMGGELAGGLGLLAGCLTQLAALGLLVIMAGAYKMDTWPSVKAKQTWYSGKMMVPGMPPHFWPDVMKPRSYSQLVSNALCTPEAQLIVILVAILFAGAGAFSIDALL